MPGQYTPGCIFTRSIGDKLAEALGVMPDPEILEWELSDQDAFFVLASDGVWEFLSSTQVSYPVITEQHRDSTSPSRIVCYVITLAPYDQVIETIATASSCLEGVRTIVRRATELWRENDANCDDISCLCVEIVGLTKPVSRY